MAKFIHAREGIPSVAKALPPVRNFGTSVLTTFKKDLGSGIAMAAGRLIATGILLVAYATPVKAAAIVQPGLLAGKVSIQGTSRSAGLVQPSTLKSRIDTVSPSRATSRLATAATLHAYWPPSPARAPGRGLVAEQLHAYWAAQPGRAAGRVVSATQFKSLVTAAPAQGQCRTLATLTAKVALTGQCRNSAAARADLSFASPNFSLGTGFSRAPARARATSFTLIYRATPSRASGLVQAAVVSIPIPGVRIPVSGDIRTNGRVVGLSFTNYYYCTPVRAHPQSFGRCDILYPTGPSVGTPLRATSHIGAPVTFINLAGLSRQNGRLRTIQLTIKPALVGMSRGHCRLTAPQPNSRVPVSSISRCHGLGRNTPLQFTGATVQPVAGLMRASGGRALSLTFPKVILTTALSRSNGRLPGAKLDSRLPLTSVLRSAGRMTSDLSFQGAFVIALNAHSRSHGRVVGAGTARWIAAPSRSHGLASAGFLKSAIPLQGQSRIAPRAQAVLAFTGATVQPVSGVSLGHGRLTSRLFFRLDGLCAAHGRCHVAGGISLKTKLALQSTSRSTARLSAPSPIPNNMALVVSRASGGRTVGIVRQALPLTAAPSRDTVRVMAQLTIPPQVPRYVFFAKQGIFPFYAKDRAFVTPAKERRFLFEAKGGGTA